MLRTDYFCDFGPNQGCGSGAVRIRSHLSCWIRIRIRNTDPIQVLILYSNLNKDEFRETSKCAPFYFLPIRKILVVFKQLKL